MYVMLVLHILKDLKTSLVSINKFHIDFDEKITMSLHQLINFFFFFFVQEKMIFINSIYTCNYIFKLMICYKKNQY